MFARAHRFQLTVSAVAVAAILVLIAVTRDPWAPLAGMAVLAAHAFVPIRFRNGGIEDERDAAHARTALGVSAATTWIFFPLAATTLVMTYDDTKLVPSYFLVWMILVAWLLQSIVASTVALILDRSD